MNITVMIRDGGNIATGLTPKLYGWNIKTKVGVLNEIPMEELASSGIYTYDFTTYDNNLDYAFLIDAGASISDGNERYIFLTSDSLLSY